MLLDDFTAGEREAVGRFLDESPAPVLVVETLPELRTFAARVISSFDRAEPHRVFLGFTGSFADKEAFYTQAAAAILEDLEVPPGELDRLDLRPLRFAPMPAPREGVSVERRFASFLEATEAVLNSMSNGLVVTLSPEGADDDLALRGSVMELAAAIGSPAVKVVVLDRPNAPRLRDITVECRRAIAVPFAAMQSDVDGVVQDAAARGTSLIVMPLAAHAGPAFRRSLDALAGRRVLHLREPMDRAFAFWDRALEALFELQGRDYTEFALDELGDPDGPDDLAAFEAAEATFAREAGATGPIAVVVDPATISKADRYRQSIERLRTFAASLDVVYLVVDDSDAPALEGIAACEATVDVHACELPPDEIERKAEEALEKDELPPRERMRLLQVVGSFAGARKEAGRATEHGAEAVALAQEIGDPSDIAIAWLSLGHSLYRANAFADARSAYLQAADVALERRVDTLVAAPIVGVGHTYFREADFPEARRCYRSGAEHYRLVNDVFGECNALVWTAEAHRQQREFQECETQLITALQRYDDAPEHLADGADAGRAEVWARRADLYEGAGRRAEATRMRERASALGATARPSEVP